MTIKYHTEEDGSPLIQGSDAWKAARCGLLTASEMKLIITPTLKIASNDKERAHIHELLAQRITRYVEPSYVGDDMLRGQEEEIYARAAYSENYAPVKEVGFITNDRYGVTLGYSPDGLIGEDGLLECKSRRAKYQVATIIDRAMSDDYLIQVQTGLLVAERKWLDFVSYCGGLPMITLRIFPIPQVQEVIVSAAIAFEKRMSEKMASYQDELMATGTRLIPTERRVEQEII